MLVSATFQSIPGPVVQANYVVTQRAPGVPLVGSPTATIALLPATGGVAGFGAEYGERLNQVDLRVGKIFRIARTRTMLNVDLFNLFNRTNVKDLNTLYGAPDLTRPADPNLGFGTPRDVFNRFQFQYGAKLRF